MTFFLSGNYWWAVYCTTAFAVNFFYYYGLPAKAYRLISFTHSLLVVASVSTQLQHMNTDVCKNYCVALGLSVARVVSMEAFVSY